VVGGAVSLLRRGYSGATYLGRLESVPTLQINCRRRSSLRVCRLQRQPAMLAAAYAPVEELNLVAEGLAPSAAGAAPPGVGAGAAREPARPVSAADVVEWSVCARDSFEVFMGKRYDPSQFAWGLGDGAVLHTQDAVTPSHAAFERLAGHLSARMAAGHGAGAGAGAPLAQQPLSPLDRFARLLSGLQALQAELGEVAAGAGGAAGGGLFRVLSDATAQAQERLQALKPAAVAAASRGSGGGGSLGGGGPVARAAPPDPSVFRALALDAAAVVEAQAQAEAAQARASALAAALQERLRALERAASR
jgi:hypothetical protein